MECLRMIARLRLDRARGRLISGFVDKYLKLEAQELERFSAQVGQLPESQQEEIVDSSLRHPDHNGAMVWANTASAMSCRLRSRYSSTHITRVAWLQVSGDTDNGSFV